MNREGIEIGSADGGASVPRVAASSYLNTAPLVWSFIKGARRQEVRLLTDTAPARCSDMLARGEVEAALVPVIEYQRVPEIAIVPDVCVGSRRRVRSVLLVTSGRELKEIRRVSLSVESRTSVALVQIIFREFLGVEPVWRTSAPDLQAMLARSDAALMIGDPAMTFSREGLRVYDLASLWREYTGLGFVFAMWMARADALASVRGVNFAAARDEGLEQVEEIARAYEMELGLPRSELREYLLENISFELDEEMREGLDLFYNLAHKHGLIPVLRPLQFMV
ncbi:MAG TPA: menaquinone biosynthesis protein [Pyrinomonadaceae bacterium]|jgi:chorismate dehydratase